MFQREVAERLVAGPRSKSYGRLSVLLQWVAEARILFDVPARAFVPRLRSHRALSTSMPRPEPPGAGTEARARDASPPPPSASAARCCARASNRSAGPGRRAIAPNARGVAASRTRR